MALEENSVWSNTDYPYACLLDSTRTNAFKQAIHKVVKRGDIVVEIGAGTGIMSLFAAEAGASKVYAVEIDPILVAYLHETIADSEYNNIIEVVAGDAMEVDLPQNTDVVIAEIIETGLLDEMQVEVMNQLHKKGIIGLSTKVIPESYETYLELVETDASFYGHKLTVAQHRWPYYNSTKNGWHKVNINPVSDKRCVTTVDFTSPHNSQDVSEEIEFDIKGKSGVANNIRLSGLLKLAEGIILKGTNAVNGDKIYPINDIDLSGKNKQKIHISYQMGAGIGSLKVVSS